MSEERPNSDSSASSTSTTEEPVTNDGTPHSGQTREESLCGSLIGEKYLVTEVLGRGGMGFVVRARHKSLNKLVAIKLMHAALVSDDISKRRFEQEAQAGGRLSHPNLIAVFDHGFTDANEPYLVMEYVEGISLEDLIENQVRFVGDDFLPIFLQVCKALQYIHNNGIIHRDLKPSNIMIQTIDGERYIKLLDFGIAKVLDQDTGSQKLTATGMVYGTPLYMSPEQCMGNKIDTRSDIYSLGCLMYECLAGYPPFRGENPMQTLFKHASEAPAPLATIMPSDPKNTMVAQIVHKCLEKDAANRYQSAADLLADLNKANVVTTPQSAVGASPNPAATAPGAPGTRGIPLGSTTRPAPKDAPKADDPAPLSTSAPSMMSLLKSVRPDTQEQPKAQSASSSTPAAGAAAEAQPATPPQPKPNDDNHYNSRMNKALRIGTDAQSSRGKFAETIGIVAAILVLVPCIYFGVTYVQGLSNKASNDPLAKAEAALQLSSENWAEPQAQLEAMLEKTTSNEMKGKILTLLGQFAQKKHNYNLAIKDFEDAIKNLEPTKTANQDYYLEATLGIAEALHAQGFRAKAETQFSKARALADRSNDFMKAGDVYVESAENRAPDNKGQAVEQYDAALAAYLKVKDQPIARIANAWLASADLQQSNRQYAEACQRAKNALAWGQRLTADELSEIKRHCDPIVENATQMGLADNAPAVPVSTPPAQPSLFPSIQSAPPTAALTPSDQLIQEQIKLEKMKQANIENAQAIARQYAANANQSFANIAPQLQRLNSPGVTGPALQYSAPQYVQPQYSTPQYSRSSYQPSSASQGQVLGPHGIPLDQVFNGQH